MLLTSGGGDPIELSTMENPLTRLSFRRSRPVEMKLPMLLVSITELLKHLPLLPNDTLYKLFVVPNGFAIVAKTTPEGWIAYRMGTFQFFGANKEVMQYREFAGIRRNAELFEAFVARYQALAEDNDLEWIAEDLRRFPTAAAQRAYLAEQGYLDA
jgi:hypothetical protein